MVSVARILGALCLILALAVAGLGVYGFVEGANVDTTSPDANTFVREASAGYLVLSLTSALVLATIGATAIVAANAGALAVKAARAADRLSRDHRPPAPAYAATQQAAPVGPWQPPSPPPAPPVPRPPVPDGQAAEGARWGPPSGPPP